MVLRLVFVELLHIFTNDQSAWSLVRLVPCVSGRQFVLQRGLLPNGVPLRRTPTDEQELLLWVPFRPTARAVRRRGRPDQLGRSEGRAGEGDRS